MIINGVPALACATFADEVKGKELVLEPLSKFPVVADLTVDRSVIYENLVSVNAYLEDNTESSKRQHDHQYSVAKCLKCGLCLEVCPNYRPGGDFFGAVLANESYLIASQSGKKKPKIVKSHRLSKNTKLISARAAQKRCPARACAP